MTRIRNEKQVDPRLMRYSAARNIYLHRVGIQIFNQGLTFRVIARDTVKCGNPNLSRATNHYSVVCAKRSGRGGEQLTLAPPRSSGIDCC